MLLIQYVLYAKSRKGEKRTDPVQYILKKYKYILVIGHRESRRKEDKMNKVT